VHPGEWFEEYRELAYDLREKGMLGPLQEVHRRVVIQLVTPWHACDLLRGWTTFDLGSLRDCPRWLLQMAEVHATVLGATNRRTELTAFMDPILRALGLGETTGLWRSDTQSLECMWEMLTWFLRFDPDARTTVAHDGRPVACPCGFVLHWCRCHRCP